MVIYSNVVHLHTKHSSTELQQLQSLVIATNLLCFKEIHKSHKPISSMENYANEIIRTQK